MPHFHTIMIHCMTVRYLQSFVLLFILFNAAALKSWNNNRKQLFISLYARCSVIESSPRFHIDCNAHGAVRAYMHRYIHSPICILTFVYATVAITIYAMQAHPTSCERNFVQYLSIYLLHNICVLFYLLCAELVS